MSNDTAKQADNAAENAPKIHAAQRPAAGRVNRRAGGRSALWVIALLFLGSGLLRLGDGTGAAIAREVEALTGTEAAAIADSEICEAADGITELLDDISTRESHVEAMELALADRLQALAVAEAAYETNITALIAAEDALSRTMAQSESAAEDDLARLTSVYENMKPKEAAALFEQMDPEFSAGFLGRMRADAAAAIMAGLEPQTAYTISVVLAGRNAGAPTN